jgi:hypothetical protein
LFAGLEGLHLCLEQKSPGIGFLTSEFTPDESLNALSKVRVEEQPKQHLSIPSTQDGILVQTRIEEAMQMYRQDVVEGRSRLANSCRREMTMDEKVKIMGKLVSEGRIPKPYHDIFRKKIAALRKRFQLEAEAKGLDLKDKIQLSTATSEDTAQNSTATTSVGFPQ